MWLLLSIGWMSANEPTPPRDPASWWAYQELQRPYPPEVKDRRWPRTDLDRFILSKLEALQLKPSAQASKDELLRRLHFDLIGLPPSLNEQKAFRADRSSNAFSNVVERLLASPHYGERWGRHWMDVVRYADTAGDNADYPVPESFRYRDYIIDAFNQDLPYDQFIVEQLAGDILTQEAPTVRRAERIVATGFLALSRRYATGPFELMHLTLEDAIDTTGRTFLGMTFKCARCHDHKSDPVTARDYYGLYGIFASTRFPYAGSEEFQSKSLPRTGFVPLAPPAEAEAALAANRQRLQELRTELARLDASKTAAESNSPARTSLDTRIQQLRLELKRRERSGTHPDAPAAYAVSEGKGEDHPLQKSGDPGQPGDKVPRCFPAFFSKSTPPPVLPTGSSGRLELARWITHPRNPLTGRTMVNRIWQGHFGHALAATPSNLGLSSEPPSHPELIDWLASEFIRSGWSIKHMHRLILHSATWQQTSGFKAQHQGSIKDPSNRWLWRQNRQRADAEAIRDSMLLMGRQLDLRRPGAHPFPPIEEWRWTQHDPFKAVYESNHRSVYLMRQRIQRHPYLALFDAPDANVSTDMRPVSSLPTQALYLMNHPFVQEQARLFADTLLAQTHLTEKERLAQGIESAWARPAKPHELKTASVFLRMCQKQAGAEGLASDESLREAWISWCRVLITSNPFLYID